MTVLDGTVVRGAHFATRAFVYRNPGPRRIRQFRVRSTGGIRNSDWSRFQWTRGPVYGTTGGINQSASGAWSTVAFGGARRRPHSRAPALAVVSRAQGPRSSAARQRAGRFQLARDHIESALAEIGRYPIETADRVRLYLLAGDVYAELRDFDFARLHWERARSMARSRLGPRHPLDETLAIRSMFSPQGSRPIDRKLAGFAPFFRMY